MKRLFVGALALLMVAATGASDAGPIRDFLRERAEQGDGLSRDRGEFRQRGRLRERLLGRNAAGQNSALQLHAINVGGRERTFMLHLPQGYQAGASYPAVFAFHGGMGDGNKIEGQAGLVPYSDRHGFIAVYPNSGETQWNDGRSTVQGKDDVGFIRALVDHLAANFGVDRRRLFATGPSNGGMMVQRLACDSTDLFRAYASVVANMPADYVGRCRPSRPVPLMLMNGTEDRLMPWAGGDIPGRGFIDIGAGGTVISAMQTLDFWSTFDRCRRSEMTPMPDRVNDGTRVFRHKLSQCNGNSEVMLYRVEGGGHTWPGSSPGRGSRLVGATSQDINATQLIIDFFRLYGL
jgi:polyhydroxybutyrate depolymerase